MKQLQRQAWLAVLLLLACPLAAKGKRQVDNVFDAEPAKVYEAVYKYAQHHGTIRFADDKHMTVSAVIYIPGGKWSYRKDYDCTISVEPAEGGKSIVNVVGLAKTKQATMSDVFGKSPAAKVVEGIREEFERSK